MNRLLRITFLAILCLVFSQQINAQNKTNHNPTWWAKYQYLSQSAASSGGGPGSSLTVGSNVDVSNECGPQSETFITINPASSKLLAAGSNEIFRDPMRGYFSTDGGSTWGAVDAPLPPPLQGTHDSRFGSVPRWFSTAEIYTRLYRCVFRRRERR
jgi:hypothetical protein